MCRSFLLTGGGELCQPDLVPSLPQVLYVVLPFHSSDGTKKATAELASIFSRCETEEANSTETRPAIHEISLAETRLTLKFLSERDLRAACAGRGALDAFKEVALDVYTRARRTYCKLPRGSTTSGVQNGPDSVSSGIMKGTASFDTEGRPAGKETGPLLFEPSVILASHPPICPVLPPEQLEEGESGELEAGEHAPEAGVPLYCCYAWANEGRTLVTVWTDGQGELLDAYVRTGETESKGENSAGNKSTEEEAIANSHQLTEGLLVGVLNQCEKLLAMAEVALPAAADTASQEGEARLPCHVIISRLGAIPLAESQTWVKLLGRHTGALQQILPAPGVTHFAPAVPGGHLRFQRSLSLEMERDPPELERFPFLEQQCASPASPGFAPFGGRSGGASERAFSSPPERTGEKPRGLLASITLVALEVERGLQLVHGVDDRQAGEFEAPLLSPFLPSFLFMRPSLPCCGRLPIDRPWLSKSGVSAGVAETNSFVDLLG
jgi:hypothetical protein